MPPEAGASGIALVSIGRVWERLGGGPVRGRRAAAFWRNSESHNIALDCERNVWYDFAQGVGGGVLDLVQTVRGCDRRDAVRWIRSEGFIPNEDRQPENSRRYALHRAAVEHAASDVESWRQARVAQLEVVKAEAIERADDVALAASANELYRLQSDGAAVVALYQAHVGRDPDGAAALITWARDDEHHAERITATIVLLLAAAEAAE